MDSVNKTKWSGFTACGAYYVMQNQQTDYYIVYLKSLLNEIKSNAKKPLKYNI